MLSDLIYLLTKQKISWLLLPLLWAFFDYTFNIIMCFVTGGVQNVLKSKAQAFRFFLKSFLQGGMERIAEFRSDKLSWLWPITVLLFSFFFYYFSIQYLGYLYKEINQGIVSLEIYTPKVLQSNLQIIHRLLILTSYFIALWTFFRYNKERDRPTWFSKSRIFHLSRVLIFDVNIAYSVLRGATLWIIYLVSVYNLLRDDDLAYNFFASDLMYGLQPIYQSLIYYLFFSLLLSFLPFVMLIRESGQRYEQIYYWLILVGLLSVFGGAVYLLIILHLRIKSIFHNLLLLLVSLYGSESGAISSQYYLGNIVVLSTFLQYVPQSLPIPQWIYYFVSIRVLVLLYEILSFVEGIDNNLKIVSLAKKIRAVLKRILSLVEGGKI